MSRVAAVIEKMRELGMDAESILAVVEAMETANCDDAPADDPLEARRAAARARTARYRARLDVLMSAETRSAVFTRDGFACVYCGSPDDLTCDHVVPVSKGGATELDNLRTACRPCNSSKRDKPLELWLAEKRR